MLFLLAHRWDAEPAVPGCPRPRSRPRAGPVRRRRRREERRAGLRSGACTPRPPEHTQPPEPTPGSPGAPSPAGPLPGPARPARVEPAPARRGRRMRRRRPRPRRLPHGGGKGGAHRAGRALWGLRGWRAVGTRRRTLFWVRRRPKKRKKKGGPGTCGGVRGWPVPCPCPGRWEPQHRAAGLCWRRDPRSLPAVTGAGSAPRAAPARCHLPDRVVRPGWTVLLGVSSGIAFPFFVCAHRLLENITLLPKCSFSRVFHIVHPSAGRRARVCPSAVTTLVRNISYMWRVWLCQGNPPGSFLSALRYQRGSFKTRRVQQYPAALTDFPVLFAVLAARAALLSPCLHRSCTELKSCAQL